jgi:hypothetical protein
MGGWFSKNEENKIVENDGQVTNNVIIQDTINVYSFEIIIMLLIVTVLRVIEFVCIIYSNHTRNLKRKFMKSSVNLNNHSAA